MWINASIARCEPWQACVEGSCSSCPGTATLCPAGGCVDLDSDRLNCGACGNSCGSGRACVDGECVCAAGAIRCGTECVYPSSNRSHCGACGNACAATETCRSGECVECATVSPSRPDLCTVPGGTIGICTDLQTDDWFCGACGTRCAEPQICVMGRCELP